MTAPTPTIDQPTYSTVSVMRRRAPEVVNSGPEVLGTGALPNRLIPTTYADTAHHHDRRQRVREQRHQLGEQQATAADRAHQQVAQRPGRRLAGDRVAATIATDTGRNSGSTMASAAAGNSAPLVSTADRNAGPVPGRGAFR